ncbi:MAG: lipid-A-disaccharide synthase [Sedimentisphaerales bacterium]|nr:lipid-A-disaccharide synthase [Sedimentisphaerales bacterium]
MVKDAIHRIFISAAEASGDAHGAKLIHQLRHTLERVQCEGLGGEAMAAAGCDLLANPVERSAMLTHAFGQVFFYLKLLRQVKRHFHRNPPDVVVVIDSPAWNFHVARAAKQRGIPVLYYIAPQLWAWGAWRIGKLRRCVDKVACILPFEKEWFAQRGVEADYVGHPLFDDEQQITGPSPWSQINQEFPTVALLPGSRKHEIVQLWKPMQLVARRIQQRYPAARFLTATSSEANEELLRRSLNASPAVDIRRTSIEAATRRADLALVASGTATLEVAAQNCPMIILYHVPALQWHLVGRWLVKTPYLSLVNILAARQLVPEFMPLGGRLEEVSQIALALLQDDKQRQEMRIALRRLVEPILQPGAARKAAELVRELLPRF